MSPRLSPRAASIVGGVGRTLIGAGIIVLLFAAYQLWGTGLQHSRAQDRLDDEFATQLEQVGDAATTTTSAPSSSSTTGPDGPTTTSTTEAPDDTAPAEPPEHGDPVARMRIPSIGVDEVVVHGVDVTDLRLGPGHFPDSPLPGEPGNAAIAGHRTTYGQPFHDLDDVEPGDEITVQTLRGEFTYEVMGHPGENEGDPERGYFIVPETAVEVLGDAGDDRITLIACHPKYSSRQRIIVTGLLVDDPVDTPAARPGDADGETDDDTDPDGDTDSGDGGERGDGADTPDEDDGAPAGTDVGDGLGGDPDALVPTVAWGAVFLATLGVVLVGGRMWRRWPAYLIGTPVLALVLYRTFEHLDRYLPSY